MFTGIIEATGSIVNLQQEGRNIHFTIESSISPELKADQSVSHDGVCLTVVKVEGSRHVVTAVDETLRRSNFRNRKMGEEINLERCLRIDGRLDGHIVQGHVDDVAVCKDIESLDGSWMITFKIPSSNKHLLVDKGSVCINGVSLTVVKPGKKKFSVSIIPYTFEHTNFRQLRKGDVVNIEYDIVGKYIAKMLEVSR